jgi:hypothetical protein
MRNSRTFCHAALVSTARAAVQNEWWARYGAAMTDEDWAEILTAYRADVRICGWSNIIGAARAALLASIDVIATDAEHDGALDYAATLRLYRENMPSL